MSVLDDAAVSQSNTAQEEVGEFNEVRDFINELLASSACPAYTMNMEQLDGYLRAIAAEPKPTNAKQWMPLVFGGEIPRFISGYSIDSITNALICLYNSLWAQVLNHTCELKFPCEYSPDKNARLKSEQWARGFMQGYIFWQDVWSQYLDENQTGSNLAVILPSSIYDEIDDILAVVSAVADADYALQTGGSIDELIVKFHQLPQKVIEYGRIAQMIRNNGVAEIS
ncbi:MAG TPA: UPF0149 family protein [Cellvibrio sp.]|nr:UPF0149 family protein [Cellvibrio sp.]